MHHPPIIPVSKSGWACADCISPIDPEAKDSVRFPSISRPEYQCADYTHNRSSVTNAILGLSEYIVDLFSKRSAAAAAEFKTTRVSPRMVNDMMSPLNNCYPRAGPDINWATYFSSLVQRVHKTYAH